MSNYTYITKQCLFCETTDPENHPLLYKKSFNDEDLDHEAFEARKTTKHAHYEMVKCLKTGLIFSRHILDDATLNKFYKGSAINFNEILQYIKNDYWNPISGYIKNPENKRVLEIGCSSGYFLEACKDNGFKEVYGCEPGEEPKKIAREDIRDNIHTGFYGPGLYPEDYFDLITCFQTLDHLSDPLGMLRNMYKNLKKGGNIYMIMHNTKALQVKIFGEKSPIIDVEHIYLFNKENIALLCQKAGFKVVSVFDIKSNYPFSYWIRMAPLPLKKMWVLLFKIFGIYNKAIPIKAGNMGVILEK